jgi:hypothetical protein
VTRKRTKTREELAAIVMERMSGLPECRVVTGVVIAPVLIPKPGHANWHAAFTTKDRQGVPPGRLAHRNRSCRRIRFGLRVKGAAIADTI